MKIMLSILLFMITCPIAFAQNYDYNTEDKAYVGLNLGFGMNSFEDGSYNTLDITSPNIAIVVGRRFEVTHIEAVVGMSTAGKDRYINSGNDSSFEYSNMFAIINYGINIPIGQSERVMLSPMIGVGFIKSALNINTNGFANDTSDVSLIWQVGSSVRFMMTEAHALELTVLYMGTDSPEYNYTNGTSVEMKSGAVNVSLGYRFWFY